MKLPNVRWPVVIENAIALGVLSLLTITAMLMGALLVIVFVQRGAAMLLPVMGVLVLLLTPMFGMKEEARYLTPETRDRLLTVVRRVRERYGKDSIS